MFALSRGVVPYIGKKYKHALIQAVSLLGNSNRSKR